MMMETHDRSKPLPHGAKGFELGEAVFLVADGKLVATTKGSREHLTVDFGVRSGVLDVHKKCTAADGSTKYVTLFTISHANVCALMQEIALPMLEVSTSALRRLRPGWMAKRGVGVVVGLSLTESDSDMATITKLRRRKLVVDQERFTARLWAPEYLEDLYELPDGQTFMVLSRKKQRVRRMLGVGFKFTDGAGPRLVWLPRRRVGQMFKVVGALLEQAAAKYGTFHEPLPWL
jgi:hypothetical protein